MAMVGLVCGFFLKGVVFLSGCGRGQWGFPMQNMPTIKVEAGGGMAGFAQLGIVVFVVGGGQGKLQGTVFGSGWGTKHSAPGTVQVTSFEELLVS